MFAIEVLESLDLLAKNGETDARKAMLNLAGEFEAITRYTDGDETDYIRKKYYEAIVAYFPERAPACYAHLIRDEEWFYAEVLTNAFVETDQIDSRTGCALLESYIVPTEVYALVKTNSAGRPHTKAALAAVLRKTGRTIEATHEQKETTAFGNQKSINDDSESMESEVSVPDPSKFPPGRLQEYLKATHNVHSHNAQSTPVTKWLRYWETAGRADEALNNFEVSTSTTRHYLDLGNALDVAFEISLKAQGQSKAFPWLIRAQYNMLRLVEMVFEQ